MVLALLGVCAVVVSLAADHAAWPMAPAFPWHSGSYSYVATKTQWELAQTARAVAWGTAVLAVLLVAASIVAAVAAVVRRRRA